MAFLSDSIDGVLPTRVTFSIDRIRRRRSYAQHRIQALLVHRHLDRDMGQIVVHDFIRARLDCGIIQGVLVVMCDGSDGHGEVLEDLHAEELCDV